MMNKYKLKLKHYFDAAHKLELDYPSKCQYLHGHRFSVVVEIEAEKLNKNGMIIDFTEIKQIINNLDHTCLNEVLDFNPTAENLACYLQEEISKKVKGRVQVTVFESPNASITYG